MKKLKTTKHPVARQILSLITGVLILSVLLFPISRQTSAQILVEDKKAPAQVEAKKIDKEAKILTQYLAKYNSPMQYHAQDFIDAAKYYNLDWKLIPSIAGVESTFGKHIPGGYNAWGWGVYGDQAIYFNSWKDGIFTLAKGLRENYANKGLNDPYTMNRVYAASPTWGSKVSYFMQDLQKFAENYEDEIEQNAQIGKTPNIAAISGQLAIR